MTLNEYRKILKNEVINYRSDIKIPSNVTFGIEIEYENVVKDTISYFLKEIEYYNPKFTGWINEQEPDISEYNKDGDVINGEISSPILKNNLKTWKELKIVLELLDRNSAITTEKCGGHVNIGAQIFEGNVNYFRNFILLWTLYNKEIYMFSSGEYSKVRPDLNSIIKTTASLFKKNIGKILISSDNFIYYLSNILKIVPNKSYDIHLSDIVSTKYRPNNVIEFRVPNGTLKEEIWQNYINFFVKFILACKNDLDIEKILYKIKNDEHSLIELSDFVFSDDTDKENFLIQALKTNKIYKKELPRHLHS